MLVSFFLFERFVWEFLFSPAAHRFKDIWLPSHFPHEGCFFCPKKPYRHVQLSRWSLGVGFPKIWVKIRMQFDSCRLERGWQKTTSWSCVFLWNFFHVQKRDVAKKQRERSEQNDIYPVHQLYIVYIHLSKKNPTHFVHHFCCCLGRGFPRRPPWRPLLRWIAWLPPAAPWRRGNAPPWRGPRRPSKRPTPKSGPPPWGCFRRGEVKGWRKNSY